MQRSAGALHLLDNTIAIDLETECTVVGCKHFGRSICENDHSLSPWHSRITVIGVYGFIAGKEVKRVFRETAAFASFIGDLDPVVTFVFHNGPFDLKYLYVNGIKIPLDRYTGDSQLAAFVLTEKIPDEWLANYELERRNHKGQRKGSKHSLKTLAPYFLCVSAFWEKENHNDDEYVIKDCEYTYRLCGVLEQKLKDRGEFEFYKNKQLPYAKLLFQASLEGICLDVEGLKQLEQELQAKAKELRHKLNEQWSEAHVAYTEIKIANIRQEYKTQVGADRAVARLEPGISYDSPAQMLWLLRDYYAYDVKSLEGEDTTGKEVLERLADSGHKDVELFLEWRKTNKILTAFIPTYRELQANGVIHPSYNSTGARTGRTSCSLPNVQQLPPIMKPLLKAKEGFSLVGFDLASIEALVIALYTNDEALFHILSNGISIHDYSAKHFLDLPCEVSEVKEKYPIERSATKNCNFALFYSAGPNRIRITFAQKGIHLSLAECKRIHQRFKDTYRQAYEFNNEMIDVMSRGEVVLNLLGRPLRIEDPDSAFMQSTNTIVQSSASDLLLEWGLRCDRRFKQEGIDAIFCLFVHDYMGAQVKTEQAQRAEEIILEELAGFKLESIHGPLPLTAEGGISKSWASDVP